MFTPHEHHEKMNITTSATAERHHTARNALPRGGTTGLALR